MRFTGGVGGAERMLNLMILVDFSTINDSMTYAVEVVIK